MNTGSARRSSFAGRLYAMAAESFRESRGLVLPVLLLAGGALFLEIGLQIPAPLEPDRSLAGAFFFSAASLVLSLAGMAMGAWGLAGDRLSGFHGHLLSKPVSGALYFLGRFLGLAARLTLIAAFTILLGGLLLTVRAPDTRFARVEQAKSFTIKGEEILPESPVLMAPNQEDACWEFAANNAGDSEPVALQFKFRPRYPRDKPLQPKVGLRIGIFRQDRLLVEKDVSIRNRKVFRLPFEASGAGAIRVRLAVTEGRNFLEIVPEDCSLAHGDIGGITALLRALCACLPLLYLSLAVALLFSAFVSIPTAFFATAVLGLLTLIAPTAKVELQRIASPPAPPVKIVEGHGDHPFHAPHGSPPGPFRRTAASIAAGCLRVLPDPEAGGGSAPLSRMESPTASDMVGPWKASALHLIVVLVLGCFLAGWRRE